MTRRKKILITGNCGFIGFHLSNLLLNKNYAVYGIDSINSYYDIDLKKKRLQQLKKYKNFKFYKLDISKKEKVLSNFNKNKYDIVIHLAAQAGVRFSVQNPDEYVKSNLIGFFNILDSVRIIKAKHFLFASTSSVYGKSKKFPLKEDYNTDKPLSFYSATKKSNEVMAYSYSNIYNIPTTCLRFFTVYGPFGRPDMSLYKFTDAIINNNFLELFNSGKHVRDFTYIDDVVSAIDKLLSKIPMNFPPYQVYNIANSRPQKLKYFLKLIEKKIGKKAKIKMKPLQLGDTYKTHADNKKLIRKIGNLKTTSIENGISKFVEWFLKYYK